MKFIKDNLIIILLLIVSLFITFGIGLNKRFDMTSDKRYTLTDTTKEVLKNIDKPVYIDVYLDGDFPANFKQLQSETINILDELKRINSNINYTLIDPLKEKISLDTLEIMGIQPSSLQVEKDGQLTQIILFPYATVKYGEFGLPVPLIVEKIGISVEEQMIASIESLEYNFVNTISKLSVDKLKTVGILTNQKELNRMEMYSLASTIIQNYNFGPYFPIDTINKTLNVEDIQQLKNFDALIIAKPRIAFTDTEKVVLDQYIMNGGKTIWAIDAVNAEMDSLIGKDKIMAYPYDLNLTDMLFSYGVRVNPVLLKDIQRPSMLKIQVGSMQGNAQQSNVPWVYFPMGFANNEKNSNPITKNINPVKFEFVSSIDTLASKGVKKTVLYQTSEFTDVLRIPSFISLEEIKNINNDSLNINMYNKGPKIMAVLLEGNFKSAYSNRIESKSVDNFKAESVENKMIVIADGDIARNQIDKDGPYPLGFDKDTQITYGNAEFIMNSLDYLLDDKGLMNLRNRKIEMKLLNQQKVISEKFSWQMMNVFVPIIMICFIGFLFYMIKKRKYKY